jgi:hypothetical protein
MITHNMANILVKVNLKQTFRIIYYGALAGDMKLCEKLLRLFPLR